MRVHVSPKRQALFVACIAACLRSNEALLVRQPLGADVLRAPSAEWWEAVAQRPPPPAVPPPPVPAAEWADPFLEGGLRVLPTPTPVPTVPCETAFAPPPPLPAMETVGFHFSDGSVAKPEMQR
mmetsp:Transcript_21729/g.48469  ORF Transcript_21729/g.48469 Transcript_21729/m.48469 type:complete len:124 (-) Transcript_21729:140-511(-)